MRQSAIVFLFTISTAIASLAKSDSRLEPAAVIDMQQTLFTSGGLLELRDSPGEVEIVGWDQPQIELRVTKSTDRRYAPEEMDKATDDLDRILVVTQRLADDHVLIRTEFPGHGILRSLGGKSGVHLSYVIHVPRQTRLVVKQQMGGLKIHDVTASMILSNRVGDIEVTLPASDRYRIDAKARIGEVDSEWCADQSLANDGVTPHRLQLRVDVGDIRVRKSPVDADSLV